MPLTSAHPGRHRRAVGGGAGRQLDLCADHREAAGGRGAAGIGHLGLHDVQFAREIGQRGAHGVHLGGDIGDVLAGRRGAGAERLSPVAVPGIAGREARVMHAGLGVAERLVRVARVSRRGPA